MSASAFGPLDNAPVHIYMLDVPRAKVMISPPIKAERLYIVGFYAENCSAPIIKVRAAGYGSRSSYTGYPVTDLSDNTAVNNPVTAAPFRRVAADGRITYPDFSSTCAVLYPGDTTKQGEYRRVEPALPFMDNLNRQDLQEIDVSVTGYFDEDITFDEFSLVLSPVKPGPPPGYLNPFAHGPNSALADIHGVRF